jgi:pimeloyl-ACP methyl ester carboxylesterase
MTYRPVRIPRRESVSVRGLQHQLTSWGAPSDDPILLLHGFMDCADTWQFLVDCLPESWSFVAPDWRGFGDSDWAPGGYWFPDYLADLENLLDLLTPRTRSRVIGHSMGANISMLYAGVRPARLQWLVNLEGIGLSATPPELAPARFAQWLDELKSPSRGSHYESIDQLSAVLMHRNPRLPPERAQFIARAWSRDAGDGRLRLKFDPRHRLVNPVLYRREEAEACWTRVDMPMLLVLGANSGHLQRRLEDAGDERLRSLFRDLQIITLPAVGHMMHHENPKVVADHIIAYEQALASR